MSIEKLKKVSFSTELSAVPLCFNVGTKRNDIRMLIILHSIKFSEFSFESHSLIIKTPKIWLMETIKGRKDKVLKVVFFLFDPIK